MCPIRWAPPQAQSCPRWCQDGSQQVSRLCPEQAQVCDLGQPWPLSGPQYPPEKGG